MNTDQLKERLIAVISEWKPNVEPQEPKEGEWWWADHDGSEDDYLILFNKKLHTQYLSKVHFACYSSKLRAVMVNIGTSFDTLVRLATPSEVLKALTDEWERRGGKEGVRFRSSLEDIFNTKEIFEYSGLTELSSDGYLRNNPRGVIFNPSTCQWAEIIKEEKIMIGDCEVEFEGGLAKFGGFYYGTEQLKVLLPTNPELFSKILKRMEI